MLKPYWPRYYWRDLRHAEAEGREAVLAYIKKQVTKKPAEGLGKLLQAGRPDLTLEWLVADATKRYHYMFDVETTAIARQRIADAGLAIPGNPLSDS